MISGVNLPDVSDGRAWVEDDLRAVQTEHHPVLRVVPAEADVRGDPAELRLEDRVTAVALHVVVTLVEVADPGDVVLPVLAQDVALVVDADGRVPHYVPVILIPLQDRRKDDHVVAGAELLDELRGRPVFGRLRELAPRVLFPRRESERHRCRKPEINSNLREGKSRQVTVQS